MSAQPGPGCPKEETVNRLRCAEGGWLVQGKVGRLHCHMDFPHRALSFQNTMVFPVQTRNSQCSVGVIFSTG
jgi:hypothetical protein